MVGREGTEQRPPVLGRFCAGGCAGAAAVAEGDGATVKGAGSESKIVMLKGTPRPDRRGRALLLAQTGEGRIGLARAVPRGAVWTIRPHALSVSRWDIDAENTLTLYAAVLCGVRADTGPAGSPRRSPHLHSDTAMGSTPFSLRRNRMPRIREPLPSS
jgi:hypothetical protein